MSNTLLFYNGGSSHPQTISGTAKFDKASDIPQIAKFVKNGNFSSIFNKAVKASSNKSKVEGNLKSMSIGEIISNGFISTSTTKDDAHETYSVLSTDGKKLKGLKKFTSNSKLVPQKGQDPNDFAKKYMNEQGFKNFEEVIKALKSIFGDPQK